MTEGIKLWLAKVAVDFGIFLAFCVGIGVFWLWVVVSHKLAMRRYRKANIQRERHGEGG